MEGDGDGLYGTGVEGGGSLPTESGLVSTLGPPSRYEVERVLLGYDVLMWSSYAEFQEAVRLEAEMECMVDTLVYTHLVFPNLPE